MVERVGAGGVRSVSEQEDVSAGGRAPAWVLRAVEPPDVEVMVELRALVMREDLERLGRFDEHRVRQRLRDSLSPQYTSVIEIDGEPAGCVTVRPAPEGQWLEHFYLAPRHQGRGLGSAVLGSVLARADARGVTVRLIVLQGSAAQRLYERHGFSVESRDPVDVSMVRPPRAAAGVAARVRD